MVTLAADITSYNRTGVYVQIGASGDNTYFPLISATHSDNDEDFADYGVMSLNSTNAKFFYQDVYTAEAFKHLFSGK